MPAPFALLEARVNRAVEARLSNATGLLDGEEVACVFDDGHAEIEGIASSTPSLLLRSDLATTVEEHVSEFVRGTLLEGTVYQVVGVEPDGAGMTLLRLRYARRIR